MDLFYRLNVFPIYLPSLRDRREDIPLLVAHFVPLLARRFGKDVRTVSPAALRMLEAHDWPGNVRELENGLERAVIRCTGSELEVDCATGPERNRNSPRAIDQSFEAATRAHIVSVLKRTNGVVEGPNGAAARLGMKRSTLYFRLRSWASSAQLCEPQTSWPAHNESAVVAASAIAPQLTSCSAPSRTR